jgi:hypothetical protein
MTAAAFCETYDLDADILEFLLNHKFRRTEGLEYVLISHLEDMKMARGDIVALQHAVRRWSKPA